MLWAKDTWFGLDKLTHAAWTYAGTLTLLLLGVNFLPLVGVVAAASVGVEAVQYARWRDGKSGFADRPSYRDLAWDGLGLVLGLAVHLFVVVW